MKIIIRESQQNNLIKKIISRELGEHFSKKDISDMIFDGVFIKNDEVIDAYFDDEIHILSYIGKMIRDNFGITLKDLKPIIIELIGSKLNKKFDYVFYHNQIVIK